MEVPLGPILTPTEIDAVALPKGSKAGQRPSDPDILINTPWRVDLPLPERQALWRDREFDTGRRMVAVLARRHGWTLDQIAAAESVILNIPCLGIQRGKTVAADSIAVYVEAAQRAA